MAAQFAEEVHKFSCSMLPVDDIEHDKPRHFVQLMFRWRTIELRARLLIEPTFTNEVSRPGHVVDERQSTNLKWEIFRHQYRVAFPRQVPSHRAGKGGTAGA